MIYNVHTFYKPEHGCKLQWIVCLVLSHSFPPFDAGVKICRFLDFNPVPHDLLQLLQPFHSESRQLTRAGKSLITE